MNVEDLKFTRYEFKHMTVYGVLRHLVIKFGKELILEAVQTVEIPTKSDWVYDEGVENDSKYMTQ
jgi:hypothetical protein